MTSLLSVQWKWKEEESIVLYQHNVKEGGPGLVDVAASLAGKTEIEAAKGYIFRALVIA